MMTILNIIHVAWVLALLATGSLASSQECTEVLQEFYEFNRKEAAPYTGSNMVYFLHVPRTAGRTFHSCLLKLGTPASKRCPKAYDHLRIDFDLPNCQLLSSHDDFSVVERLPPNTAVVTQLRDPVERFLSAYEFAIEVSARQVKRMASNKPPRPEAPPNRVITEEVWPWSHLIPFFADNIAPRLKAAQQKVLDQPGGYWTQEEMPDGRVYYLNPLTNATKWVLEDNLKPPPLNPYDNDIVMPLAEFVKHPIARELLHNGEALQVLGLTNYSHWDPPKAARLRTCLWEDADVAAQLAAFARRRVARFSHVGTTERLKESVESAAAALHMRVDGPAYSVGGPSSSGRKKGRRLAADAYGDGGGDDTAGDGDAGGSRGLETDGQMATSDGADGADVGPDGEEDAQAAPGGGSLRGLARNVRQARARLGQLRRRWNELAAQAEKGVRTPQMELRRLRSAIERAKAEVDAHSKVLVEAREEATAGRRAAAPDRMLDMALGIEYQRCAKRAQDRNKQRKDKSLKYLSLPDGRSMYFTKAARRQIPGEVLEDIRRLNQVDLELHHMALQQLDERRAQQAAAGSLQPLPDVDPLLLAAGLTGPAQKPD